MKKSYSILFAITLAVGAAVAQNTIPTPVIPEAQPPEVTVQAPTVKLDDKGVYAPTGQTGATKSATYGMSFREAWSYGGWIMWILLAISVYAVSMAIYLLASLRASQVVPRRLVGSVRDAILNNEDDAARRLCDSHPCAFSSIAMTALDCIRATNKDDNSDLLNDLVQSEGSRITDGMQSQAQILLDLAAIAPMIGLLGTTLGMLQAFGSIAQDVLVAAKPVILAQGVSKAIITTIAGLMVAIPCMFAYAIFRRRVSALAALLESAAAEIRTAIAIRKDASK